MFERILIVFSILFLFFTLVFLIAIEIRRPELKIELITEKISLTREPLGGVLSIEGRIINRSNSKISIKRLEVFVNQKKVSSRFFERPGILYPFQESRFSFISEPILVIDPGLEVTIEPDYKIFQ